MTRLLQIAITSGDRTCAESPGKFCDYVRVKGFGQSHHCAVFGMVVLEDRGGWLQRTKECIDAEKVNPKRR